MPAPLAKGLIIAASVLVAAGIAIYESPQVRDWVDQSRRKIAIALHSLGDEFQPRRPSESEGEFDERQERIRRKRNALVRKAREEGVAVDLDELVRIGREEAEREDGQRRGGRANRSKSFDELVGDDGTLKQGTTTGADVSDAAARRRAGAGFAAGAAVANPFSDDNVLFDVGDGEDDAPSLSSATLDAPPLLDLTPDTATTAAVADADADAAAQSFYSFTSTPDARPTSPAHSLSSGTLTPRSSSPGASTAASMVGSQASDVGVLSMLQDIDMASEANDTDGFSDGGFTDAFSEAGFSDVGGPGAMTPSSWTDVGSEEGEGSEWGGVEGAGGVSQVQL